MSRGALVTMRRFALPVLLTGLLTALLTACGNGSDDARHPTSSTGTPPVSPVASTGAPSSSVTVTPPATPGSPPPTAGRATASCVNGWTTPAAGTQRFLQPLGIVRRTTGVTGPLVVVDMRYFEGPESPPSEQGYLKVVQRWYVKLYAKDDPAFQGRFLVEARRFGRGLSAVAPYDTHGFRSPDWIGFQYDSADTTPKTYPRLPGRWEGIPYDFVKGGGGLTIPGLPEAVVGCLAGT